MVHQKPLLIVLVVVVAGGFLAALLSRVDTSTLLRSRKKGKVVEKSQPFPTSTPDFYSMDLSTEKSLSKEDLRPFYENLEKKIAAYRTVQVRVRMEVPYCIPDTLIESEVRFDAVRPDKGIKLILTSMPETPQDPFAEWKLAPFRGTQVVGPRMRVVEYREHGVYDMNLDSTEEALLKWNEKLKNDFQKDLSNPLIDLLGNIPADERLKEVIEAAEVKTSEGPEVRVLSRITGPWGKVFSKTNLFEYFFVRSDCFEKISLRQDVFDEETGDLKKTEYQTVNQEPVLIQRYLEVKWEESISDDRFILELPDHARIVDMTRLMAHKAKVAIPREQALKMIEEGTLDWPTLLQRNRDY